MPLYFAYGSNMSADEMARRCPRSTVLGLARLERHRLAVMREGWLTAVRDPRACVHGVLWDLALSDVPALDRYEGVAQGLYAKAAHPVVGPCGPRRALVYFGANSGPGVFARGLHDRDRRRGAGVAPAGTGNRGAGNLPSGAGKRTGNRP